ncbi:MAG: hypothetical protein DWQ30_00725 [Acidobacteria bacterium]|nr:MAG: hypothetical protein DWQ30_00725 [Acidobacteriota bacterium]
MAVLPRVAHPDPPTALELHLSRALDLQEEGVDRVVDPEQLEPTPAQRAGLDLLAAPVGQQRAAGPASGQRTALPLFAKGLEVDLHDVAGPRVERHVVALAAAPAAAEERLVVAGEGAVTALAVAHLEGHEVGLEVLARQAFRVAGAEPGQRHAGCGPVRHLTARGQWPHLGVGRSRPQSAARAGERRQRLRDPVLGPARERLEPDPLELQPVGRSFDLDPLAGPVCRDRLRLQEGEPAQASRGHQRPQPQEQVAPPQRGGT